MKIFLLFYMCHFAMGLTHCYKTTVFFTFIWYNTECHTLDCQRFNPIHRTDVSWYINPKLFKPCSFSNHTETYFVFDRIKINLVEAPFAGWGFVTLTAGRVRAVAAGLAIVAAAFCLVVLVCNALDADAGFFLAISVAGGTSQITVVSSAGSTLCRFEVRS